MTGFKVDHATLEEAVGRRDDRHPDKRNPQDLIRVRHDGPR
jgi:hypothetical protein